MKDDSPPDSKTIHERFTALGRQILAVPRAVVEARDKKWQTRKQAKRKKR